MENQITQFTSAIAEIQDEGGTDFKHPLLTKIKFVFATSEGMRLSTAAVAPKQGIRPEDFDEVIKTAVNTPIKMRFLGKSKGVGAHYGSIPVGHIIGMEKTKLEDGVDALIAEAVLYTEEFPQEVEYLKQAFAEGKAPGISYEIRHSPDKSVVEDGVEWIKDLITQAATIVKSPAYGSRTAIMALASSKDLSDDEFNTELLSILTPKETTNKGGSNMDDKIKELEGRLEALAATKDSEIEALKAENSTLKDKNTELTTSVETLSTENGTLKRTQLIDERSRAYAEAGLTFETDAEKAAKKKELLADMSEEVFTAYIDDLKELAKKSTALASASNRGNQVPRLAVATGKEMSLDDLRTSIRENRRN